MAKPIMIQGTMSNVGKSIITAGLCRIFYQDGYNVAPFKSQNMAINSYITADGLEIGCAQAVQAEAAGKTPQVEMNPILLKPGKHMGSQVVLNGKTLDYLSGKEYFQKKLDLIPHILKAYNTLAKDADIIVIEGAGSPVELNLKKNDIVNMGLAKMLNAPTIVVGDIERGGIFATLFGTIKLMEEEEQKLVKGTIINKFKGNPKLLQDGFSTIEKITGVPLLGLVPTVDIQLEDEDSLSSRITSDNLAKGIDIGVVAFPNLVNFTDMNPLQRMGQVGVRYISSSREMEGVDLLVLPGTASPIEDMKWLTETGLEEGIKRYHQKKGFIFGLGGGSALLGRKLVGENTVKGLGLLPIESSFGLGKEPQLLSGKIPETGGEFSGLGDLSYRGYRLIQVDLAPTGGDKIFANMGEKEVVDGVMIDNVLGVFSHGIFEDTSITENLLKILNKRTGLPEESSEFIDYQSFKELEYNKLAHVLRTHLDMEAIYEIIFKG